MLPIHFGITFVSMILHYYHYYDWIIDIIIIVNSTTINIIIYLQPSVYLLMADLNE